MAPRERQAPGVEGEPPFRRHLRQPFADDRSQIRARFSRNAFDDDLFRMIDRVRLDDVVIMDLAGLHVGLQPLNGVIGFYLNGVVHLHLQDQVGAAFQVQAEVNAVSDGVDKSLLGKALGNAEDAEQEKQQNCDD